MTNDEIVHAAIERVLAFPHDSDDYLAVIVAARPLSPALAERCACVASGFAHGLLGGDASAPPHAVAALAIAADGRFDIDTASVVARAASIGG